ncbi:hypothetical protein KZO77_01755 [Prevotella melaninogenica]|jgi:hypothetical protein|uniref:Uncharacterized protein n=1 Tax=Prevotella melaninogenica TaxID=28132 RepID=A0ABS6Y2N9_9BACT|nr:hypothetical protein [Prevotella melaninogenica]MBW4753766.1 hypothetical protein [Prevotella melaninogenica]
MKEKKGLSLVYALKEYARVNGKGGPIIEGKRCFTFDDIKAAFNAGRESVVENMPELKWNNEDRFGDFCECTEEGYSNTPFGIYSILQWYNSPDIAIYFAGEHFKSNFQSVEQAKLAANEDYKKRIKQALGL